ncbi:MAG TPA: phospholipid carrier-dependent glycosyltransferase, partial [Candidatus Limnocylindria bacterium]|nr:phospholipid carrier-dependent glycosyltransferase [Candidatus Limnocylindria bacterium]
DRSEGSAGAVAFDTTALPGEGLALAFDVSGNSPADDAGRALVTTASDGGAALVAVDSGSNAFAWRLAGVIFGAILVALVYLLGATMFRDRRVAILAGAFVAFDLMSYAMSRIAMNDIFVAVFIVAAYLLFWQVWSGRWSASAWWAMPAVGVCIGLAAASKWVGFYALAGLLVLVIGRSDLGRLLLLGGLTFGTVVAGIGAPWPFTLVLAGAALLMLALLLARPPSVTADDLVGLLSTVVVASGVGIVFVLAFDSVGAREPRGAVELVFGLLARGAQAGWPAIVMLVVAGLLIVARAVRTLRSRGSEVGWFLPSSLGGFGWAWVGACLIVVPLVVYGLSYLPYIALGHDFAGPDRGAGYGWSVEELHAQMFSYHFGLTSGHDAASPWWSWPLDLKPVWFYSDDFDGQQVALIYNGGNPVLFWAGIPAIIGAAVLAWRRGSLALALLAVAFAFQYLPWTRIERATFQYHYLTAVVFAMVAVACFVALGLRRVAWRELAIGFLIAAAVAGLIIYPVASALPMPDWYANAMRALPPWNFYFQFPDPPQGERGDLFAVDALKAAVGAVLAVAVVILALALPLRGSPPRPHERVGAEP